MNQFLFVLILVMFEPRAFSLPPLWVQFSNQTADTFAEDILEFRPQIAAGLGLKLASDKASRWSVAPNTAETKIYLSWEKKLKTQKSQFQDADLDLDMDSLTAFVQRQKALQDLTTSRIPFFPLTSLMLQELTRQDVFQDETKILARWTQIFGPGQSWAQKFKQESEQTLLGAKLDATDYPSQQVVTGYLEQTIRNADQILAVLTPFKNNAWKLQTSAMQRDVEQYDLFIKKQILPKSLTAQKWKSYAQRAEAMGIDLVAGRKEIKEYIDKYAPEFRALCKKIANTHLIQSEFADEVSNRLRNVASLHRASANQVYADAKKDLSVLFGKVLPLHLSPNPPLTDADEIQSKSTFVPLAYLYTIREGVLGRALQKKILADPRQTKLRTGVLSDGYATWENHAELLALDQLVDAPRFYVMHSILVRLLNADTEIAYQTSPQSSKGQSVDLAKIYATQLGYSESASLAKVNAVLDAQPLENVGPVYFSLLLMKQKQNLKSKYATAFNEACFYRQYLTASGLPHLPVADFLNLRHRCKSD